MVSRRNRGADRVGRVCTLRGLAGSRSGLDLEASVHLPRAFWRQSAPGGRHSHAVPPPGGNLGWYGLPGDGWSDGWRRGRLHRVAGRRDAHEISASAGRLGSSYRAGLVALCEAFACLRDRPTKYQNPLIVYICKQAYLGRALESLVRPVNRQIRMQLVPSHCDLHGVQ